MKLGAMDIKTLFRISKYGWYAGWCPATANRMKHKGLITIDLRGAMLLTDAGRDALGASRDVLRAWGWWP